MELVNAGPYSGFCIIIFRVLPKCFGFESEFITRNRCEVARDDLATRALVRRFRRRKHRRPWLKIDNLSFIDFFDRLVEFGTQLLVSALDSPFYDCILHFFRCGLSLLLFLDNIADGQLNRVGLLRSGTSSRNRRF